jgi:LysM repeat protein
MVRTSVPTIDTRAAAPATAAVCPYLLSADGAWRASTPAREHRCTAVAPAAILAPDKQRRLCLVADHVSCATYRAAMDHGGDHDLTGVARPSATARPDARPIARTSPLVLDHGRVSVAMPALRGEPRLGQVILVALMGLAFVAILLARIPLGSGSGGAGPSSAVPGGIAATVTERPATPSPTTAVAEATVAPSPTLVPTEAKPTKAPGATKKPATNATTYKVKRGDTLSGIATKFKTTWQVLAQLNKIKDPGALHVGQVLQLP